MRMLNEKERHAVAGGLIKVPDPGEGGGGFYGGGTVYTDSSGRATGLSTSYSASGTNWADRYDQFNLSGIGSATSDLTYNGTSQATSAYQVNGTGSHDIDLSSAFNTDNGSQSLTFDVGGDQAGFTYHDGVAGTYTHNFDDGSSLTGTVNSSGSWLFDFNTGETGDGWTFDISAHGDGSSWGIDGNWHF